MGANWTTTNVAVAKSPVLPVTWMVWAPKAAVDETVNVVELSFPPERVQDGDVTMVGSGVLVIVHVAVSAVLKPLPVTVTVLPGVPELGVSEIIGPETVNDAVAKSPVLPVTVMA